MKEKNRMIIVEGPQGTGKTTLTNYLRDNISSSNLYRLSGSKDKTKTGKEISKKMYYALTEYLEKMESIPMDLIFDRTFFTDKVYCELGYKEFNYDDLYEDLVGKLDQLNYEIYLIVLYLKDTNLYKQRLDRKSHHNYQAFSIQNSIDQQNTYLEIAKQLKNKTHIHIYEIAMDNFEESYKEINEILNISMNQK